MRAKKETTVAKSFFLLTFIGLACKGIGAIYRIPLTNILGAEGIGLYQMVFPLYTILICLTSGSITTVISSIVSQRKVKNLHAENAKIVKSSLICVAIQCFIGIVFLAVFSQIIALFQKNIQIKLSYFAIAPSLIFIGISSVLKGYFYGEFNFKPTAISQTIEQIVRLIACLFFAKVFIKYGLEYGVAGAFLGITIAELFSCLALLLCYKKQKVKLSKNDFLNDVKKLSKQSMPLTFSNLIMPLSQFIDSVLIIKLLSLSMQVGEATSLFGLQVGAVNSLVNMPVVIVGTLSGIVIPKISEQVAQRNIEALRYRSSQAIKMSFIISIPCFFGFFVLAQPIIRLFYPTFSEEQIILTSNLLRYSSISILFLSVLQIINNVFQSVGKAKYCGYLVLGAVSVKIAFSLILIPKISILGFAVSMSLGYGLALFASFMMLRKLLGKNINMVKNISQIMCSGVIMFVVVAVMQALNLSPLLNILSSIFVGAFVYFAMLFVFKVFSKKEVMALPFGKIFFRKTKKLQNENPINEESKND